MGHMCRPGVVKEPKDNWFCLGIHKIPGPINSQYTTCKCHKLVEEINIPQEVLLGPQCTLPRSRWISQTLPQLFILTVWSLSACLVGGLNGT